MPPAKRQVNMVFQAYALFPHMSVEDNVAFGLQIKKVAKAETRERVASAIASVRMTGFEKRKPGQLSGGQQQRVALARALVNRPAALLLDEPLGALDLKLRKEMQLELKHIQIETGTTFVYVTHDQEEALTMSDRIAVMNQGIVEQIADAAGALRAPGDGVRGRLHRRLEPDPRARRPRRRRRRRDGPRRRRADGRPGHGRGRRRHARGHRATGEGEARHGRPRREPGRTCPAT